jgi:hypothetical protein
MAQLRAIIVTETEQGEVLNSYAFSDDGEGLSQAHSVFGNLAEKNKAHPSEVPGCIAAGFYNRDHVYVTISYSRW